MDHHCPWINNCIGFYNKKFLIQLLIYFILVVVYLDIIYIYPSYQCFYSLYLGHSNLLWKSFFMLFNHFVLIVLTVLGSEFLKFHLTLVFSNCTTIESLDEEFKKNNKYDVGMRDNWEQVFGKNILYWFIPIINEKSYPIGDGLSWKTNEIKEDLNGKKEDLSSMGSAGAMIKHSESERKSQDTLSVFGSNRTKADSNYNVFNTNRSEDNKFRQGIELMHIPSKGTTTSE